MQPIYQLHAWKPEKLKKSSLVPSTNFALVILSPRFINLVSRYIRARLKMTSLQQEVHNLKVRYEICNIGSCTPDFLRGAVFPCVCVCVQFICVLRQLISLWFLILFVSLLVPSVVTLHSIVVSIYKALLFKKVESMFTTHMIHSHNTTVCSFMQNPKIITVSTVMAQNLHRLLTRTKVWGPFNDLIWNLNVHEFP